MKRDPVPKPLRLAKLTPPRLPKIVERLRLYRELDRRRGKQPLVWVVGAPGVGKTTLVNSYLRHRKLKALWYRLDAGDQDPATLFHYLNRAVQAHVPRSDLVLPHLTAEYIGGLPVFTRRFFERMFSHRKVPRVLVLDNYQDLPPGSVMQHLLPLGIETLPQDVTAIVMSRELPPEEWVKLRADQQMSLMMEESLRLTDQEEQAFIALHLGKGQVVKFDQQRAALGITKGWLAGLILLIEQMKGKRSLEQAALSTEDLQVTFEYLAQEALGHLGPMEQDLLVRSAVFPWMTGEMLGQLSGYPAAGKVLEHLARRRFFTERGPGGHPVYHYHPLFRAFLRHRFEACFSPEEGKTIWRQAGHLLEGLGEPDEVVELFKQAGEVQEIIRLIQSHAATLLNQGRSDTLLTWLGSVPEEWFDEHPWLWFWSAAALMVVKPEVSQLQFQRAQEGFERQGEGLGQILSMTGYIESLIGHWGDLTELDDWLPKLEGLLVAFPGPFPVEVEVRILAARILLALRPHEANEEIDGWAWRLLEVLDQLPNGTLKALGALSAVGWLTWTKPAAVLESTIGQIRPWVAEKYCPPILSTTVLFFETILYLHTGQVREAARGQHRGVTICEREGLNLLKIQITSQYIWSGLALGDWCSAKELLDGYKPIAEQHPGVHGLQYHALALWLALETQKWENVAYHLEEGNRRMNCGGSYQEGHWLLARALVHFELGQISQAHQDLERGAQVGEHNRLITIAALVPFIRAYFAFQTGEEKTGLSALSQGLSRTRTTGIRGSWFWRRSMMTMLCVKALEHDIEVAEAHEIIQKYDYRPETPPYNLYAWPWDVRISTLGLFRLEVGDTPVQFGRKVPRRVLALLKGIIAFGGRDVREDQVIDALWPEADGDRAYRAYATALHRLRKLLGDESLVIVKDRRISLDPYRCWVDVWALEKFLEQATTAEREGDRDKSLELCERGLGLYQGAFLDKEDDAVWAVPTRERLRKKYVAHVESLCRRWQGDGKVQEARQFFARALEIEAQLESLQDKAS